MKTTPPFPPFPTSICLGSPITEMGSRGQQWTPGTPLGLGTTINPQQLSGIDNIHTWNNWALAIDHHIWMCELWLNPSIFGRNFPLQRRVAALGPTDQTPSFVAQAAGGIAWSLRFFTKNAGNIGAKTTVFLGGALNHHTLKNSFKDSLDRNVFDVCCPNYWNVPIWNSSSGIAAVGKQTYAKMITIYACMHACVYI